MQDNLEPASTQGGCTKVFRYTEHAITPTDWRSRCRRIGAKGDERFGAINWDAASVERLATGVALGAVSMVAEAVGLVTTVRLYERIEHRFSHDLIASKTTMRLTEHDTVLTVLAAHFVRDFGIRSAHNKSSRSSSGVPSIRAAKSCNGARTVLSLHC